MFVCSFSAWVRPMGMPCLLLCLLLASVAQAQTVDSKPRPLTWFRADALHNLVANAPVTKWPDSGSAGNDAMLPSNAVLPGDAVAQTAQAPTYLPTAVNGRPAVHFTAEGKTSLVFPRPVQDDFTILCVFQSAQGVGKSYSWREGAGLVGDLAYAWDDHGQDDFGISLNANGQVLGGSGNWDRDLSSDEGFNDGKPHLVTLKRVKSLGEITLYVDGERVDSSSGANKQALSALKAMTLGVIQRRPQMIAYLTGDIAEVQFYGIPLVDADRQALESGLKTQYGIVSTAQPEIVASVPASLRLQPVLLPPDPKPAIHGPQIVGATPGHPFLFRVPATGDSPLTFACANLPTGLTLDPKTGILSGTVPLVGRNTLHLSVTNARGKAERSLTLIAADHSLALTPPMGWDALNLYGNTVDDAKMRAAADALVKSGLAAHGWSYLHVNDTWQGIRDKTTREILPNRRRFPDMKALGSYIHGQGLKFGLTSAPTEHTCGGYPGSLGYVAQDAATYAAWGVDYLEYDWCPLPTVDETPPPSDQPNAFKQMHEALNKTNRDVFFAVDTFGEGNPADWAPSQGANSWVSARQLFDDWDIVTKALFSQPWLANRAAPGHWNNPGLLMLGKFGFGNVRATRLTPAQQMAQLSQAALLSSPLWLSCDLTSLDPNAFHPSTTAMLTNDEVLDVNQDPAGHAASQLLGSSSFQIWSKPLADGTVAVGLFNIGDGVRRMRVKISLLGLTGPQPVRDLWLHQDLGNYTGTFVTDVPAYGVALVKIGKPPETK